MLTLEFAFPARRYHATPWGHHVNEGLVEWPPCPWRLLRALIATWHRKGQGEVAEDVLAAVVRQLSSELPEYRLPHAITAHTRHYMPLYKGTSKVFDAFIDVPDGESLVAHWPTVNLVASQQEAVSLLASRMLYLGRAESWVEARVLSELPDGFIANSTARSGDGSERGEQQITRLLAPVPGQEYVRWRESALDRELTRALAHKRNRASAGGKDAQKAKLTKKEREKVEAMLPADLVGALSADTAELHRQGWSDPPGSRWVDYLLPKDLLSAPPTSLRPLRREPLPTVARFALASQVLPHFTNLLSVSDRTRKGLNSRSDAAPVFSGKDSTGRPIEGHGHAFILPEANDRLRPRVTHVTVHAPMGFDDRARRALRSLRKVWGRGGHDVQLVLLGIGQPEEFAGTEIADGQCPLLAEACVWISRTPFVPTRHPKVAGKRPKLGATGLQIGSPEHDLRRLLRLAGLPEPSTVEPVANTLLGGKRTRWLGFRTTRRAGGGRRGTQVGSGFRIVFHEPVRGPIAVGYGAHFGLGVFVPEGTYEP